MKISNRNKHKYYLLIAVLIYLSGCTAVYNDKISAIKNNIRKNDPPRAVNALSKSSLVKSQKDRLLFHLEAGLVHHLSGEYEKSNEFLENAEWLADELYTKSIAAGAASFITSDNIIPYYGNHTDYIFTNYYKILNYLFLNKFEDALVEVRRLNHKFSVFEINSPFLHYISAILYEYAGEISDSFIEYKKAYSGYNKNHKKNLPTLPYYLKNDLSSFCNKKGFVRCNELPKELKNSSIRKKNSEIVIIIETGFVPYLAQEYIDMAIPQSYYKKYPEDLQDIYYLNIALPYFIEDPDRTKSVTIEFNGDIYKASVAEDMTQIFKNNFEEKKPAIVSKTIARAITKYITYKSVRGKKTKDEKENFIRKLLGFTMNIFTAATERADTRSWLTLPDKIFIAKIDTDPGTYSYTVKAKSISGNETVINNGSLTVSDDEKQFLVYRSFTN